MTEVAMDGPDELVGRRWVFGPATLDERSMELVVGGRQVQVERKPLEVLLYLLHHAGEVVTKNDLAENLWPGRILTESVLSRCISVLRQALEDDNRSLIRTVHGFGYRLVARVRVESAVARPVPAMDFKPGDSPPTRPQWRLVERLGTGGHGEAWLARHEKTGDARVFKFALDPGALSSLKREITLYRLLNDSLGPRAAVARILEWNLEEPPYFIEMEHVAGGNLQTWSDAQGGAAALPMADRLEIVAQIAEALAAAHSVGALHKDLKPGNVLVDIDNGRPRVRLCDFGSGTVLDPQRLEALGITRLGFTRTMARQADSATPLYLAPEVIAGQPCTVQADIYALGILLYQMVAGDLRKALAPGWEADIDDELLREDIAAAAAGNPHRRLTDASQLAERLRMLEQRRAARAAEMAVKRRAERMRRVQEELRRTRVFAVALLVLTLAAVAGGTAAFRARNEAVAATATANAVSAFLMEDVLRIDSGVFRPSETSYEALLNRASAEVDVRLKGQPKAAAGVHTMLGRRFQEIGRFEAAMQQYEKAFALSIALYGEAAEPTLMTLDRLAWMHLENGRPQEALNTSTRLRTLWLGLLNPSDLAVLMVKTRLARTAIAAGAYDLAESELRTVIREAATPRQPSPLAMNLLKEWLGVASNPEDTVYILDAYSKILLGGSILEETGEGYDESVTLLNDALNAFSRVLGDEAELTALARLALSVVLSGAAKYEEAEKLALRTRDFFDNSLPPGHYARGLSMMALGRLRIEQRRYGEAQLLLKQAISLCRQENGCPPRLRSEFSWNLGSAYVEEGMGRTAIEPLRMSLEIQQQWGDGHPSSLHARILLAEALRQTGALDEALAILSGVDHGIYAALKPYQQTKMIFDRTYGLLLLQKGSFDQAISSLENSLRIVTRRHGVKHWRTLRARDELEAAKRAAEASSGAQR